MHFFSQYKLYLFLGAAILVAVIAWAALSGSPEEDTLTTTNGSAETGVDKELIGTLLQLRTVSLSGTIFSDPAFRELQDFGTQITPEPIGRPNPFLPASFRSTSTSSGRGLFPTR